jgi:hypothetical protein
VAPQTRAAPAAALPANPPAASRAPPAPRKKGWFSGLFGSSENRTPDQFGSENLRATPRTSATIRLSARMVSYSFSPITHIFTVTLSNGQTWRQEDGDTSVANLIHRASTYSVSIEPGFLGSYNMRMSGVGGAFKVRRIK